MVQEETEIASEDIRLFYSANNLGFFLDEPNNTEQAKLIKTPVTDVSDHEPESEKDALKIDDIEDEITERGIVDNLKDFDLDYLVFEENGEKDSVPFDFMGDGFKSMVGILWELVEDDESEIVMIEEPENHMHPGYVQEMFDFLVTMAREDDIQLFITTHSIDFINYMFDENLPEEHREFLKDELSVIRMESPELAAVFDYEEAKKNSEELHLDLRGI
jgi:predicted ATPase